MTTPGRILDAYDNGDGSVTLQWQQFGPVVPDSYNVYLNGVLNQNVAALKATISGLKGASYNGAMVTPAATYVFKVAAVKAGVERAAVELRQTALATSIMLTTPMKRPFPFPNTQLD